MCLLEGGAGHVLGCAKSSEEGVSRAVGRKAHVAPFPGGHPPLRRRRRASLAAELQAWGLSGPVLSEPVKPGYGRAGGRDRDTQAGHRSRSPATGGPGRLPALHSGARVTRLGMGPSAASQERVPEGVPVGRHGPGHPLPAGPVPGATRGHPRDHPCYCPAPQRGDPSADAAPHRPGPPAWRQPGGEGRPGSGGLNGGLTAPPLPPGTPQGQLRGHCYLSLSSACRAPALVGGGDCLLSPPAPELASPPPTCIWGRGLGAELLRGAGVRDALVLAQFREQQGSFWEGRLERSLISDLVSEFRSCMPQFTLCPTGRGREMSGSGLRNPFPLDLSPLLILFWNERSRFS